MSSGRHRFVVEADDGTFGDAEMVVVPDQPFNDIEDVKCGSGPVNDKELGTIMGCLAPERAAQALVDLANLRGGPDNITVIVARATGESIAAEDPLGSGPKAARRVHPALWGVLGLCLLTAASLRRQRCLSPLPQGS